MVLHCLTAFFFVIGSGEKLLYSVDYKLHPAVSYYFASIREFSYFVYSYLSGLMKRKTVVLDLDETLIRSHH